MLHESDVSHGNIRFMVTSARPKPKAQYHHGNLHDALVKQAVKLIRQRGDVQFSLRDLAADLGVSHAAVYRHFSSKAALLADVAIHGFGLLKRALSDAGHGLDAKPAQQLARLGAAYVGMAVRHRGHFAAMFAPEIHRSAYAPEVLAAAEAAYQVMLQTVTRLSPNAPIESPSVQARGLRCWALVHGLASLQVSGNLSACLGYTISSSNPALLAVLIADLLGPGGERQVGFPAHASDA